MKNGDVVDSIRRFGRFGILLCFLLSACGGGGGGGADSGNATVTNVGVTTNAGSYLLYVPPNFKPNESALVLALHGLNGYPEYMLNMTQLNLKADQAGFAVAYPGAAGTGPGSWNSFFKSGASHIPYLRGIIQSLQAGVKPNPKKIYVIGISDGGLMAHRVGVELSDLVAAIGVVGGSLYQNDQPAGWPTMPSTIAPVSVMILHGDLDLDQNAGYCGKRNVLPTQDVVFDYWVGSSANDCASVDTAAPLCVGTVPSAVNSKKGTSCKGGTEVQFHKMIGATHNWHAVTGNWSVPMNNPSAPPYNPNFNASTGISTNDLLWNFFAAHPKP
ncbi:MAG: hypothetical protein HYS18_04100 [Burkholderiales bacterium]|nr:hypothetical protein [Burkholderiales bacterium]